MIYHLVEVEPFDKRSPVRIAIGVVIFILLFILLIFVSLRYDIWVLLIGIPSLFLGTYLLGGAINHMLFPPQSPRCVISLSAENIIVRRDGVETVIPNRNVEWAEGAAEDVYAFRVMSKEGDLVLPVQLKAHPRKRQCLPKNLPLSLVIRQGQIMIASSGLETKYYHYESF